MNFDTSADSTFTPQEVVFEEESYIDDIPFDTKSIADNCLFEEKMNLEFSIEDEAYVDDIPFDTKEIALESSTQFASTK